MLAASTLVLAGLAINNPALALPAPALNGAAAVDVVVHTLVEPRSRCLSLRCRDRDWNPRERITVARHAAPQLPGAQVVVGLAAPATPREAGGASSTATRVGARYGVQALRDGPVSLGVQLGAGYRLAGQPDDGIAQAGAVLRGEIALRQRLGERAQWQQRVLVEAGRGEHFLRQAFSLDVRLWPAWQLEADVVLRRATDGSDRREGQLGLRRRF